MLDAVLDAGAEFLAAPGEGRPIQQVEVALAQLDEADQVFDRAVAGAEIERAGAFLLHLHEKILPAWNARVLRVGIDFLEVAEILQPLLTDVDAGGVEDIARQDDDFTAQHLVFGAGISCDVDSLDKGAGAFRDDVGEIDHAGSGGSSLRNQIDIDITAGAVAIDDRLGVILQSLGAIDRALPHFDERAQGGFFRCHLALEGHFADVILQAFVHHDHQAHPFRDPLLPHFRDRDVNVAVVLVKLADAVEVLLQLRLVEPPRFVEEGDRGLRLRLHLMTQRCDR